MSDAEIAGLVLGGIGAAAAIPHALRFVWRGLTMAFDFVRKKRRRLRGWYARCDERDRLARLVNDPDEAKPVFIESLLDSEKIAHWPTQIAFGDAFLLYVTWKYRGFWAALGWHVAQGSDEMTWAVLPRQIFLSVSGRASRPESHWTGSAVIDAATAYIDDQIEESGVADYTPPRWFRFLRWLRIQP